MITSERGARRSTSTGGKAMRGKVQKTDDWQVDRRFLTGIKTTCAEAPSVSAGALIESGACLMCWLYYEFTDSMMEISGLHYDHAASENPLPKKKSPERQLWACVRADRRSHQGPTIAKN